MAGMLMVWELLALLQQPLVSLMMSRGRAATVCARPAIKETDRKRKTGQVTYSRLKNTQFSFIGLCTLSGSTMVL